MTKTSKKLYKDIPATDSYCIVHSKIKVGKQNLYKATLLLAKKGIEAFNLTMSSIEKIWKDKKMSMDFRLQQLQLLNKGKPAMFGTSTLDGYQHSTTFKEGGQFNTDKKIKEGGEILKDFWRVLRKALHKDLGYSPHFIFIIEPHKDKTPHSHWLIWIEENERAQFWETFNRVLRNERAKQTGIGRPKYQRVKYVEANETSNPAKYVGKYITKMVYSDNYTKNDLWALDGYYRHFEFRQFTTSNVPIPSEYLQGIRTFTKNIDIRSEGYDNIADWALNNIRLTHIVNKKYGYDARTLWTKTKVKNQVANPKLIIQKEVNSSEFFQGVKTSLVAKLFISPEGEIISDTRDWQLRRINLVDIYGGLCEKWKEETKFAILDYIYPKCPRPVKKVISEWKILFNYIKYYYNYAKEAILC